MLCNVLEMVSDVDRVGVEKLGVEGFEEGGQWEVAEGGLGSDNTDQELLLVSDVFCVSSLN